MERRLPHARMNLLESRSVLQALGRLGMRHPALRRQISDGWLLRGKPELGAGDELIRSSLSPNLALMEGAHRARGLQHGNTLYSSLDGGNGCAELPGHPGRRQVGRDLVITAGTVGKKWVGNDIENEENGILDPRPRRRTRWRFLVDGIRSTLLDGIHCRSGRPFVLLPRSLSSPFATDPVPVNGDGHGPLIDTRCKELLMQPSNQYKERVVTKGLIEWKTTLLRTQRTEPALI